MEWVKELVDERYTLHAGTCRAVAWNTAKHGYAASLHYRGANEAQYGFETLERAQAWCLTRLAEMRTLGRCSE